MFNNTPKPVPYEELRTMVKSGCTDEVIASEFNCSVSTIQKRKEEYGLKDPKRTKKPRGKPSLIDKNDLFKF